MLRTYNQKHHFQCSVCDRKTQQAINYDKDSNKQMQKKNQNTLSRETFSLAEISSMNELINSRVFEY